MVVIGRVLRLRPAGASEVLSEPEPPVPCTQFRPLFHIQRRLQDAPLLLASQVSLLCGIICIRGSFRQLKKAFFDFTSFSYCPFLYLLKNFQPLLSSLPLLNPSGQACPHHSGRKASSDLHVTKSSGHCSVFMVVASAVFGTAGHTLFFDILFFTWLLGHVSVFPPDWLALPSQCLISLTSTREQAPRAPPPPSLFLSVILSWFMALNTFHMHEV